VEIACVTAMFHQLTASRYTGIMPRAGGVGMKICRNCLILAVIASVPTLFGQNLKTANATFTAIDVPGAAATIAYGINTAGDVVGAYALTVGGNWHGFRLSQANFTFLDYPGAQQTLATGINSNGLIVGFYLTGNGYEARGFTYDGSTFVSLQYGTQLITEAWGLNDSGEIVGETGNSQLQKGFMLRNGKFTLIEPPGRTDYYYAFATGVNTTDQIVGFVVQYTSNGRGYFYQGGSYKYIQYPGAASTELNGINDNKMMVGYYANNSLSFSGFAMQSGTFLSLAYPGATYTICYGVNNAGEIVGEAVVGTSTHGFITSPITNVDFH
jgi:hypothetical protein